MNISFGRDYCPKTHDFVEIHDPVTLKASTGIDFKQLRKTSEHFENIPTNTVDLDARHRH